MRISIFMAQTDVSDFAKAHPDDGQKFAQLLRQARPDWTYDVHRVAFGEFPENLQCDAGLITGSIASVNDNDAWIARLFKVIRDFQTAGRPMFGACFGHQAIAAALGGTVGNNPDGWIFGLAETRIAQHQTWMTGKPQTTLLHAAHKEQVLTMPSDARAVGTSPGTPVAAMAIGDHIATTQYHPEMERAFLRGLVPLLRGEIPDRQLDAALAERRSDDNPLYAQWIARFFETAHQ